MVIEDLHWVDDASGDLVNHLMRAAATRPWAGVITRRPGGKWQLDPKLTHVTTLDLVALTPDDIRQLAIEASQHPLTDATIDLIVERSQGNPLFALELARAAGRGDGGELPDSVEKVISARIDDLAPELRHLVRIASVFGNSFDIDDIAPVLDEHAPGATIEDPGLSDIVERRMDGTWAFRHALYRDAIYEGLPYRQRQQLHRRVGESLEHRVADTRPIAALLSVHFAHAKVRRKAWSYSLAASDDASLAGANADAVAALERALRCAPRTIGGVERGRVYESLGDTSWRAGRLGRAVQAFQRSRNYLGHVLVDDLRLRRKIGGIRENEGRQSVALRWYSKALHDVWTASDDPSVRAQVALLLLATAGIRHRQGDNVACARLVGEAELRAIESGDDKALALAYDRQVLAGAFLGTGDNVGRGNAAIELYRRLGDTAGEARVLNNMGIAAYFEGNWTATAELYAAAVERSQAAGDVVLAGIGAVNQAEILGDQGHWASAASLLDNVIRNWEAIGYEPGVAVALSYRGTAHGRAGRHDQASADLEQALLRSSAIGVSSLVAGARLRLAELALLIGQADTCDRLLDEVDAMPEAAQSDITRRSRLMRAIARLPRDIGAGVAALEALTSNAADYDEAVALAILDRVAPIDTPRAEHLTSRLGIVAFPAFPFPDLPTLGHVRSE